MNAREELTSWKHSKIVCAKISTHPSIYDEYDKQIYIENGWNCNNMDIYLKTPYTEEDLENFWEFLDFEYDESYGSQELSGTVWFEDGTWLDREEYDGSEWWELRARPDIPEELINKPLERENNINDILK